MIYDPDAVALGALIFRIDSTFPYSFISVL